MDGASTENVSQPNQDQTGSNGEMKSNVARNTEQLHQSLSASTSQVDKKDAETVDSVQHESVNINNDLSSSKNTKEQVPHLSQNGLPTGATDSESIHTNTLVNQAKTVSSANDANLNESIASRTTAESPQNLSMGDSQGSIPSQTIPAVSVHSVTGISQNCADSQHSIPCNSQASKTPEQNSITEHKSEIVNTSTCTSSTANVTPHVSEQNISSSVETKSVSSSQQVTLSSSSNPSNIVSHPQTSLTTHLLANTTSQSVGQLSQTVLQSQNSALSENSIVTSQSTFPNVQPVVETGQSKMQTTHIPTPSSRTEAGINRPHSVSVSHLQPVVPHQQDAASVQTVMSQQIHESRVSITGSITHTSEAIPTPDTHGLLHAPQEHVRVTQQMSVPPANTTKQAPRMPHHRGQNPTKTKRQSKTSQAQKSEIPPVSHPHMMPRIMQEFARGMPQIPQMFDPRMIAAMSNFGDPRLQRFSDPRIVSEMQQRFALLRMRMEKQFAQQQQQHHQGSQAHASHAGLSHGQDATQQQQEAGMHQSASVSHPSQPPTQRSFQSQEQVGTYVSQPQHTPMSVHEQHLLQNQSQTIQEHGALSHASQMPVMSSHPSNTQQSSMAHPHAHGNQSHSRMAPNEISYQPSINPPNSRQQAGSQGTPPQDDIKNTGLMMGLGPQDPSVPHHDTPVQASTPNNIPTHGGIGHPALPASSSQMVSQAVNKPPSAQPQTVTWAEAARVPTSYPGHQFVPASVGSPTYPLSGAKDDIKPVPVLSAGQGRPPSAGSSRPPSAEGSSRPPSAGRPQSGGRPPSTGRPPLLEDPHQEEDPLLLVDHSRQD